MHMPNRLTLRDHELDTNVVCARCGSTDRTLRWHCPACGNNWCKRCTGARLHSFDRTDPRNGTPCPRCGGVAYPNI